MSTTLKTGRGKDLYQFWGPKITEAINDALADSGNDWLINLASVEYWAAVDPRRVKGRVLNGIFKDEKAGEFRVISFFAKRARGLLADFIVRERVNTPAGLRDFAAAGYRYDAATSTESSFVFLRAEKAAVRPLA